MEEFFRDNHFSDKAILQKLPVQGEKWPQFLCEIYPALSASATDWQLIGDVNINSLNFRVGAHYVKVIQNENAKKNYVFDFPNIAKLLHQFNIPTVDFVLSKYQRPIEAIDTQEKKFLVYVQRYAEADFFTGSIGEFQQALEIIEKLITAAPALDKAIPGARQVDYRKVAQTIQKWSVERINNADSFDQFLLQNKNFLAQCLLDFKKEHSNLSLYHCDLHPHNLLTINKEIVAVIDLESFVKMPQDIFEAFSIFKLARKCISKDKNCLSKIQDLVRVHPNRNDLLGACRAELLRRLSIVLQLHYENNDKRFDQDLYKHISGLKEAVPIFT